MCVAQLDRALGYGPRCREFESSHARCKNKKRQPNGCLFLFALRAMKIRTEFVLAGIGMPARSVLLLRRVVHRTTAPSHARENLLSYLFLRIPYLGMTFYSENHNYNNRIIPKCHYSLFGMISSPNILIFIKIFIPNPSILLIRYENSKNPT